MIGVCSSSWSLKLVGPMFALRDPVWVKTGGNPIQNNQNQDNQPQKTDPELLIFSKISEISITSDITKASDAPDSKLIKEESKDTNSSTQSNSETMKLSA